MPSASAIALSSSRLPSASIQVRCGYRMARAPIAVRRKAARGSSELVIKTSTPSPGGAGGGVLHLSRHTVAIRKNELINPYVSATTSTTEKIMACGLREKPHRQINQYKP